MLKWCLSLFLTLALSAMAWAQDFNREARVEPAQSTVEDRGGDLYLELHLSQGVPFRLVYLDAPDRIMLVFDGLRFDGVSADVLLNSDVAKSVSFDDRLLSQSTLVLELARPLEASLLSLSLDPNDGRAVLTGRFSQSTDERFAALAASSSPPVLPPAVRPKATKDGRFVVVIDPGHGGRDPGADFGGLLEADLMLMMARELREALLRQGVDEVVMTRDADTFVSLQKRLTLAHQAQADAFLSLHADALIDGRARGATVYTLSSEASDGASARLAERHARDDLVAGIDLAGADDEVVQALMGLSRSETTPRSLALKTGLVAALKEALPYVNSNPSREAAFNVLKAPDVPSVLLELGFLSDPRDAENLQSPEWRADAVRAIAQAVVDWRAADLLRAENLRQ